MKKAISISIIAVLFFCAIGFAETNSAFAAKKPVVKIIKAEYSKSKEQTKVKYKVLKKLPKHYYIGLEVGNPMALQSIQNKYLGHKGKGSYTAIIKGKLSNKSPKNVAYSLIYVKLRAKNGKFTESEYSVKHSIKFVK